jgi:hypothetical protein
MSELWQEVGLLVLEGVHDPQAIAAALPSPSRLVERAPQRHALAKTIHVGDANDTNVKRWAIFVAAGRTFVAPPGGAALHTAEIHWQRVLSLRFGLARWYAIYFAAPHTALFRDGAQERMDDHANEGVVLAHLSAHLGVPDARAVLSVRGGESWIFEIESSRW